MIIMKILSSSRNQLTHRIAKSFKKFAWKIFSRVQWQWEKKSFLRVEALKL